MPRMSNSYIESTCRRRISYDQRDKVEMEYFMCSVRASARYPSYIYLHAAGVWG